jgi:hypothetical protein
MEALTPDEAFELGNLLRDTAVALGEWRVAHQASLSRQEWDELDEREIKLLNSASSTYTGAIGLVLADSELALARLQSSVKRAKTAVRRITVFKQALDLASALILFAGAITSGNVAGIPAAIVSLEDAAAAILSSSDSDG